MKRRQEDATVWIGYADFLTTMAVLFFLVAAASAAKLTHASDAVVVGVVSDSASRHPVAGCLVQSPGARTERTGPRGAFDLRIESISQPVRVPVEVRCGGYAELTRLARVIPSQTSRVSIQVARAEQTVWQRITLSGDALFDPLQFTLKHEGVRLLIAAGEDLKKNLRPGEMIVVQGHTDDLPIQRSYGKTNWMLSGERAAAAVPILTDSVRIPGCQVSVMGFGPSRPVPGQEVRPGDSESIRAIKRARNRRIELWRVSSLATISGNCVL